MKKLLSCLFVLCSVTLANGQPDTILLSLPDINWGVKVITPGFIQTNNSLKSDFSIREYSASNKQLNISMKIYVELNTNNFKSSIDYANFQWTYLKNKVLSLSDTSFIQYNDAVINQYLVKEYKNEIINQKIAHTFIVKDNVCIDLYLTKTKFTEDDQQIFDKILKSICYVEPYKKTSYEYFIDGSTLFMKAKYEASAKLYDKALEIEKESKQLSGSDLWYVLIDNLGMSYGILGYYKKAIDIFEYGVTINSTYPMFYYNLACAYAEMNDIDKAISNLDKAFQFKNNVLKGEELPNPNKDSSFEKLLKNDKFKKALKNMK